MELIALVSALHPEVFSGLWVLAVLVSLIFGYRYAASTEFRRIARIWTTAFGPLLVLSFGSAVAFNLKFSRIEALEIFAGGLILSLVLLRFKPRPDWLVTAATVGSVLALGVAGFDLLITQTHRAGLAFHPINYGIAVGALCLVLASFSSAKGLTVSINKQLVWGGLIAGLISLVASGSRGPILAVFVVLGLMLLMNGQRQTSNPQTKKILVAAIGFAITGFAVMVIRSVIEYQTEPHHSLGLRMQILTETMQQILRQPWFGLGVDQAGQFFADLGLPTNDVNHAHNSLLNAVLELGVLGGLAFLWLFFYLGRLFYQNRSSEVGQLALAMLVFFFLCAMTQDIFSHSFTRKLFAFYLAILIVFVIDNKAINKTALR